MYRRYLLDTDTCSYVMKRHPVSVLTRLQTVEASRLGISVITLAELRYGVERLNSSRFTQADVDFFISHLTVHPWEARATQHYATLRTELERQGTPIGNMDLLIATHALSLNAILVSNNQRHFSRVPGLILENWVNV